MGRRLMRKPLLQLLIILAAVAVLATMPAAAADLVSPRHVDIGAFFDGTSVAFEAEIPAGAQAVVEVIGNTGHLALLRKGRRGGLWMAVGEIQIDHTPNLYLVLTSSPRLPELAGEPTPWGFDALKSQVTFAGTLDPQEKDRFFKEFIQLKESEGIFAVVPGGLKIKPAGGGERITGTIDLPAKVAPGEYQVRLSVVQDGKVIQQKTDSIKVSMVGFPAAMASLAFNHAALYGLIAIVIAIVIGAIMGLMFQDKGGH